MFSTRTASTREGEHEEQGKGQEIRRTIGSDVNPLGLNSRVGVGQLSKRGQGRQRLPRSTLRAEPSRGEGHNEEESAEDEGGLGRLVQFSTTRGGMVRNRPRTHSHLEKERQSKRPVALNVSASERDPVGNDDTRADEERLEDKESTSKMGRGDLTVDHKGDC